MSENKRHGKKRPKSYYKKCANIKRKRLNQLESGMKGFIVSCDREKEATREAYNLLNDFADQLYGPEKFTEENKPTNSDDDDESGGEEDLETAMKKEVDAMKDTKPVQRRFQRLESRTKNCLFIKTDLDNPAEVTDKIFETLLETKTQRSRFAMRLMPVHDTCKAVNEEIIKTGKELFEKFFSTPFGEGHTYSIVFKARNNNSIKRDDLIPLLSHAVGDLNPAHTVEHNNPDFLISIQILCTICCFSILKNFNKFKKYNLQEVTKTADDSVKQTEAIVKPTDETVVKLSEGDNDIVKPDVSDVKETDIEGGKSVTKQTDLQDGKSEAVEVHQTTEKLTDKDSEKNQKAN